MIHLMTASPLRIFATKILLIFPWIFGEDKGKWERILLAIFGNWRENGSLCIYFQKKNLWYTKSWFGKCQTYALTWSVLHTSTYSPKPITKKLLQVTSDVMVDVTCGPHSIPNTSRPAETTGLGLANSELTNFCRDVIKSNLIK